MCNPITTATPPTAPPPARRRHGLIVDEHRALAARDRHDDAPRRIATATRPATVPAWVRPHPPPSRQALRHPRVRRDGRRGRTPANADALTPNDYAGVMSAAS